MDQPPRAVDALDATGTVSAPQRGDLSVDDLDDELARLLMEPTPSTCAAASPTDVDVERSFCAIEPLDPARMQALEERVSMLERRLEATLDAFEAEVADRMAKAAAEAAEATRAHVLAALQDGGSEDEGGNE